MAIAGGAPRVTCSSTDWSVSCARHDEPRLSPWRSSPSSARAGRRPRQSHPAVRPKSPSAATTSCSRRTSRTSRVWPSTRSTPRSSRPEPTTTSTWRRATPAMTAPARSPRASGLSGIQFSTDSGRTWTQPTYTGFSARVTPSCLGAPDVAPGQPPAGDTGCVPDPNGPIGTLPHYDANGMVSNGDPELVFGPVPDDARRTSPGPTGSGCTTRTSPPLPGQSRFCRRCGRIAISRTDDMAGAIAGDNDAWMDPVVVTRQNSGPVQRQGTDLGRQRRDQPPLRQRLRLQRRVPRDRRIRTGAVRSFHRRRRHLDHAPAVRGHQQQPDRWATGLRHPNRQRRRRLRGVDRHRHPHPPGRLLPGPVLQRWPNFERPGPSSQALAGIGQFDPAQGRFTIDGIAGARTNTFPSSTSPTVHPRVRTPPTRSCSPGPTTVRAPT